MPSSPGFEKIMQVEFREIDSFAFLAKKTKDTTFQIIRNVIYKLL